MLHAKQMVVILKDKNKNWTKYVKFGGNHNPAGISHNMWEMNSMAYNGNWEDSDVLDVLKSNPIKEYIENVFKLIIREYSEPFPWGELNTKISILDKIIMKISQLMWF